MEKLRHVLPPLRQQFIRPNLLLHKSNPRHHQRRKATVISLTNVCCRRYPSTGRPHRYTKMYRPTYHQGAILAEPAFAKSTAGCR